MDQRNQVASFGREVNPAGEDLGEEVFQARHPASVHLGLQQGQGGAAGNRKAVDV
jgi:hypothetical protein